MWSALALLPLARRKWLKALILLDPVLTVFAIVPFVEAVGWLPAGLWGKKGVAAPLALGITALLAALFLSRPMPKADLRLLPLPYALGFFVIFTLLPLAQELNLVGHSVWERHRYLMLGGIAAALVITSVVLLRKFDRGRPNTSLNRQRRLPGG